MRRAFPSPGPLWRRLRIFCFGSTAQRGFTFPPSGAIACCCLRCSFSASLSYRFTLSLGPSSAPFGCLPLAGLLALLLGTLRCFLRHLPSSSFASLRSTLSARLSRWFSSSWPSQRSSLLASFRRSPVVFLSSAVTPVCPLSIHLLPSVSRSLFHSSLLLGYIAVRLCGWSRCISFALPCSCPPHFPGRDGFRAVSPLPFFSLSALPVSGSLCGRGFVPPLGGVHAAGAAGLEVSPVRTHGFSDISTSVAFLSDGHLLCFFSLCFLCFFVLCMPQPKKSREVVLYGHMKCRRSWVPPEFLLALSRTLSLRSVL